MVFLFSQISHFIAQQNSLDSIAYSSIFTQLCLGEFLEPGEGAFTELIFTPYFPSQQNRRLMCKSRRGLY